MIEIQRILCPIDFSDHSRRALDHAMAIARWYKSTVTVLHVFSPAPLAGFGPTSAFAPVVLTPADFEQLLADTKAFAETERAPGVAIAAVVREGHTAGAILEQAIGMAADLLVIGTHGRFGLERLLLGSVAEKVLRRARCPVMTVPTQSRTPCRQARSSIAGFSVQWTSPTRHRTHWRMRFQWRRKPTGG